MIPSSRVKNFPTVAALVGLGEDEMTGFQAGSAIVRKSTTSFISKLKDEWVNNELA